MQLMEKLKEILRKTRLIAHYNNLKNDLTDRKNVNQLCIYSFHENYFLERLCEFYMNILKKDL